MEVLIHVTDARRLREAYFETVWFDDGDWSIVLWHQCKLVSLDILIV
jgi:hypothetical protein